MDESRAGIAPRPRAPGSAPRRHGVLVRRRRNPRPRGRGRGRRQSRQQGPFIRRSLRMGDRPGARGVVRPGGAREADGRDRSVGAGCVPGSRRARRSGPRQRRRGRVAAHDLSRDLQRRRCRDPIAVGQPVAADGVAPRVGHRRVRARGAAGEGARAARGQPHVGSAGCRRARSRQRCVGSRVGSVQLAGPAGALPHRCEPHDDELLRDLSVARARRRHEARDRRHAALHR